MSEIELRSINAYEMLVGAQLIVIIMKILYVRGLAQIPATKILGLQSPKN